MTGFIGFVHYKASGDTEYPTHRITNIGKEKVEYCDEDEGNARFPSLNLKSIGDKIVEYNKSCIKSIGGKPVNYEGPFISSIGDQPVKYKTSRLHADHLISIGDKLVKYNGDFISSIGDEHVGYSSIPEGSSAWLGAAFKLMVFALLLLFAAQKVKN